MRFHSRAGWVGRRVICTPYSVGLWVYVFKVRCLLPLRSEGCELVGCLRAELVVGLLAVAFFSACLQSLGCFFLWVCSFFANPCARPFPDSDVQWSVVLIGPFGLCLLSCLVFLTVLEVFTLPNFERVPQLGKNCNLNFPPLARVRTSSQGCRYYLVSRPGLCSVRCLSSPRRWMPGAVPRGFGLCASSLLFEYFFVGSCCCCCRVVLLPLLNITSVCWCILSIQLLLVVLCWDCCMCRLGGL